MDKQQKCVIMSLDEIEHAFRQIERRIGVHERDVVVLEDRSRAFYGWWMMTEVEAPGIVKEDTGGEDAIQDNQT